MAEREADPLVILPISSLRVVLNQLEKEKGSPLSEDEVHRARDTAILLDRSTLREAQAGGRVWLPRPRPGKPLGRMAMLAGASLGHAARMIACRSKTSPKRAWPTQRLSSALPSHAAPCPVGAMASGRLQGLGFRASAALPCRFGSAAQVRALAPGRSAKASFQQYDR
jgi:hypothetical protein